MQSVAGSLIPMETCTHTSSCRVHPAMIVVGTDDPGAMASTRLQIFEYSEDTR